MNITHAGFPLTLDHRTHHGRSIDDAGVPSFDREELPGRGHDNIQSKHDPLRPSQRTKERSMQFQGSAMEALPHMHKLLESRPDGFASQETAIKWQ